MDCMEGMKGVPDKYFDLAVVDPPYFKGAVNPSYYNSKLKNSNAKAIVDTWEIPGAEYFDALFRVSKRQIIWGCNYYAQFIPHSSRIIWDKMNDRTPFSQAEIASYSKGVKTYIFRHRWNGMIQQNMKEKQKRFHPTQKPIELYEWTLEHFAKRGDKILDTHVGSASSLIACYRGGYDYIGFELDKEYFDKAQQRIREEKEQVSIQELLGEEVEQLEI